MNNDGKRSMKPKPLVIGLVIGAAGVLGVAGYGMYMFGMQRGMGMAGAGAGGTAAGAEPGSAGAAAGPLSIAQGEEATRRHIQAGLKAGDMDPSNGSRILY